jgi:hypothetical protein
MKEENLMKKTDVLSQEEKDFLKRYQNKPRHGFRELLAYCAILNKLTND